MSARVDDAIPPTTGCLESLHGHHNESTRRHNTFWASMYRLATQIVRSVEDYGARIRHNFNRAVRMSREFAAKADRKCKIRSISLAPLRTFVHADFPSITRRYME
jgi:hypothetical protein